MSSLRSIAPSLLALLLAGCNGLPPDAAERDPYRVIPFPHPIPAYSGGLRDVAATRYNTCIDDLAYGAKYAELDSRYCFGSTGVDNNFKPSGSGWTVIPLAEGYPSHKLKSDHVWTLCDIVGKDGIVQCWGDYDSNHTFSQTWAIPGAIDVKDVARYEPTRWTYFIDSSSTIQVVKDGVITPVAGYPKATQIDTYQDLVCAVVGGKVQCGEGIIANLSNVTDLSCGQMHCCAAMSNGSVGCWGIGQLGDLGDGVVKWEEALTEARIVPGVSGAVQVAAGEDFSCARINDGTIRCWGSNEFGQLGGGLPQGAGVWFPPVTVSGINDAYMIAAGWYHACAIRATDATLWCWGRNDAGQLGSVSGAGATAASPLLSFHEP